MEKSDPAKWDITLEIPILKKVTTYLKKSSLQKIFKTNQSFCC